MLSQAHLAALRVSIEAQRFARAPETGLFWVLLDPLTLCSGERGASRPSSAFQRHKEQLLRRIIVAAPQAHSNGSSLACSLSSAPLLRPNDPNVFSEARQSHGLMLWQEQAATINAECCRGSEL